jgi:hypothetical protein
VGERVPLLALLALVLGGTVTVFAVWYYFTPTYSAVGYMPTQPVPYSHAIHVEQLGLDCRYCHTYVDNSDHANIPDAGTCMNCHNAIPARQPGTRAHPRQLRERPAGQLGAHPPAAGLCLLQPLGARRARRELCGMPRPRRHDGRRLAAEAAVDGLVPGVPPQPRAVLAGPALVTDLAWQAASQDELLEENIRRIHNWQVTPPQSCSGCHR